MSSFETTVSSQGATIICATGHLDMVTAPEFKALVAVLVAGEHPAIVLDLSSVEFVDSSGIGAIISGLRTTREAGSFFRIAGPTDQVRAILEMTSIDRILPPYESVEAALEAG